MRYTVFDALQFGWGDAIQIALVSIVLYRLLLLVQGRRMLPMLAAVLVLAVVYGVASVFDFTLLVYLIGLAFTYGAFALIVVFQPELRALLARLGHAGGSTLLRGLDAGVVEDEITDAVDRLARSGVGAIIVIERDDPLTPYVDSGSALQARLTADLLATIFTPYSPLHDGAVLVRGENIIGAGCILPLSQATLPDRSIGTRHRAALGLSEETDALVIVVSEETAMVSVAQGGALQQGLSPMGLRDILAGRPPRSTAEYQLVVDG